MIEPGATLCRSRGNRSWNWFDILEMPLTRVQDHVARRGDTSARKLSVMLSQNWLCRRKSSAREKTLILRFPITSHFYARARARRMHSALSDRDDAIAPSFVNAVRYREIIARSREYGLSKACLKCAAIFRVSCHFASIEFAKILIAKIGPSRLSTAFLMIENSRGIIPARDGRRGARVNGQPGWIYISIDADRRGRGRGRERGRARARARARHGVGRSHWQPRPF